MDIGVHRKARIGFALWDEVDRRQVDDHFRTRRVHHLGERPLVTDVRPMHGDRAQLSGLEAEPSEPEIVDDVHRVLRGQRPDEPTADEPVSAGDEYSQRPVPPASGWRRGPSALAERAAVTRPEPSNSIS